MATVRQYRSDLQQLTRLADADLQALWRQVSSAEVAREALSDILPQIVDVYGSAAAALAADWYDELRDQSEVAGRFSAIAAEIPGSSRTDALAGWAVGPLFSEDPDFDLALGRVAGGLQRIIANAGRDTVTFSSVKDPRARGWQRVGGGECQFCQMLIDRGAVYSEASADFPSHDHCTCAAEPVWR